MTSTTARLLLDILGLDHEVVRAAKRESRDRAPRTGRSTATRRRSRAA